MRKLYFLIAVVLILAATGFFYFSDKIVTGEIVAGSYTFTKAVCNETHCQDYEVYCEKDKLVKQTPLTGAVLMPEEWEDPRETSEIVCDRYT